MSCADCIHFFPDDVDSFMSGPGMCCLQPVRVRIEECTDHCCGQFRSVFVDTGANIARRMRLSRHDDWGRKQQERALKAEKVAKELRRQIKELKAKQV